MFIDKCLNIVVIAVLIATFPVGALAQEKTVNKPQAQVSDKGDQGAPAQKQEAPAVPAPQAAPTPQPELTPQQPPEHALDNSPMFYASYPAGAPPVRFLEKTQRSNPMAKAPKTEPPRPVRSAGAPIAIALVYERAWATDSGYNLFGDKNRVKQFGLWASYDIWTVSPRLILAAEGGWAGWEEKSHYMDAVFQTRLSTGTFHLGANLRYAVQPWLQPHIRVAGGVSLLDVEIKSTENDVETSFKDHDVSPFASIGAGFMLRTPTRLFETNSGDFASLSMGVVLEGGYTFGAPASFTLEPKEKSNERILLKSADLGKLDRSAGYLRISLVVRF
jgi:hypothetical protein